MMVEASNFLQSHARGLSNGPKRQISRNMQWVAGEAGGTHGGRGTLGSDSERWERGGHRGGRVIRGFGRGRGNKTLRVNHDPHRSLKTTTQNIDEDMAGGDESDAATEIEEEEELSESATPEEREKFWKQLQHDREEERKKAIAEGKMDDPNERKRLEDAINIVGTCPDMCPRFERYRRERQNNLVRWEMIPGTKRVDHKRAVKMYERAAGDKILPSDLRPPEVLKKTLDYLFHDMLIIHGIIPTHDFVRDRSRAVRNDFALQHNNGPIAIECHERCARYHILALHYGREISGFSPTLEAEQLRQALLSLMEFYDDNRGQYSSQNEFEMRVYQHIANVRGDVKEREGVPAAIASHKILKLSTLFREQVQRKSQPITKTSKLIADEKAMEIFGELAGALREEGNPIMTYLVACLIEYLFGVDMIDDIDSIKGSLTDQDIIDGVRESQASGSIEGTVNEEAFEDELDEDVEFDDDEVSAMVASNEPMPVLHPSATEWLHTTFGSTPSTSVFGTTPASTFPATSQASSSFAPVPTTFPPVSATNVSVSSAFGNLTTQGNAFSAGNPLSNSTASAFGGSVFGAQAAEKSVFGQSAVSAVAQVAGGAGDNPAALSSGNVNLPPATSVFNGHIPPLSTSPVKLDDSTDDSSAGTTFSSPSLFTSSTEPLKLNASKHSEPLSTDPSEQASLNFAPPPATTVESIPVQNAPPSYERQPLPGTSSSLTNILHNGATTSEPSSVNVSSPPTPRRPSLFPSRSSSSSTLMLPKITTDFSVSQPPSQPQPFPTPLGRTPPPAPKPPPISLPSTPTILHTEFGGKTPLPGFFNQSLRTLDGGSQILSPINMGSPFASRNPSLKNLPVSDKLWKGKGKAAEVDLTPAKEAEQVLRFLRRSVLLKTSFDLWKSKVAEKQAYADAIRRGEDYSRKQKHQRLTDLPLQTKKRRLSTPNEISSDPGLAISRKRTRKRVSSNYQPALADEALAQRLKENRQDHERRWMAGTFLRAVQSLFKGSSPINAVQKRIWLSMNPENDGTAIWLERKFDVPASGKWQSETVFSIPAKPVEDLSSSKIFEEPVLLIFECTPLEGLDDEIERKLRVLDDCARLRDICKEFPAKRHFIPSILVIRWTSTPEMPLPEDLLNMITTMGKEQMIEDYTIFSVSAKAEDLDLKLQNKLNSLRLDIEGKLVEVMTFDAVFKLFSDTWKEFSVSWMKQCSSSVDFNWAFFGKLLPSFISVLNEYIAAVLHLTVKEGSKLTNLPTFEHAGSEDMESIYSDVQAWLNLIPVARADSISEDIRTHQLMGKEFPTKILVDQLVDLARLLCQPLINTSPIILYKTDIPSAVKSFQDRILRENKHLQREYAIIARRSFKRPYASSIASEASISTLISPSSTPKRRRLSASTRSDSPVTNLHLHDDDEFSPPPSDYGSSVSSPPMDMSVSQSTKPFVSVSMLKALTKDIRGKYGKK